MPTAHPPLTPEEIGALGRELDELSHRLHADLGQRDADYIRAVIKAQRGLELAGRGLLFAGFLPPAWLGGVAALSLSKILDNMEIGHNVSAALRVGRGDARPRDRADRGGGILRSATSARSCMRSGARDAARCSRTTSLSRCWPDRSRRSC